MSLIRQLWLAIALLMLIALGGSFFVSSLAAKGYLQEQLTLKNLDNANSLASVLGQMPKDAVEIELLVSSQFDLGGYEYIRLADPRGKLIVERVAEALDPGAPDWFVGMLRIEARPGVAQVQDGWKQYGTLTVSSHTRFAYRALWTSTKKLVTWFLLAALLAGAGGTLLLRVILRPLDDVVTQAEAIGARRFITTPDDEAGLNYLCAGFKTFFHHVDGPMKIMGSLLAQDRAPSEIVQLYAAQDAARGRNDPCTCGSGKKWKHCHGAAG